MADDEQVPRREATERFRHLPERVRPEDMVAEVPSAVPMPADGGRDGDTEFMIRHLVV